MWSFGASMWLQLSNLAKLTKKVLTSSFWFQNIYRVQVWVNILTGGPRWDRKFDRGSWAAWPTSKVHHGIWRKRVLKINKCDNKISVLEASLCSAPDLEPVAHPRCHHLVWITGRLHITCSIWRALLKSSVLSFDANAVWRLHLGEITWVSQILRQQDVALFLFCRMNTCQNILGVFSCESWKPETKQAAEHLSSRHRVNVQNRRRQEVHISGPRWNPFTEWILLKSWAVEGAVDVNAFTISCVTSLPGSAAKWRAFVFWEKMSAVSSASAYQQRLTRLCSTQTLKEHALQKTNPANRGEITASPWASGWWWGSVRRLGWSQMFRLSVCFPSPAAETRCFHLLHLTRTPADSSRWTQPLFPCFGPFLHETAPVQLQHVA